MDFTVLLTSTSDMSFTMLVMIGIIRVRMDRSSPSMITIVTMAAAQSGNLHFLICIFFRDSDNGPPIRESTPAISMYISMFLKYQHTAHITAARAV